MRYSRKKLKIIKSKKSNIFIIFSIEKAQKIEENNIKNLWLKLKY